MSDALKRRVLRSETENTAPCGDSFARFLRHQHPTNTVKKVAELTGASESTIDKWLARVSLPHLRHLGPLLAAYGPSVIAAIFPSAPRWLDEAVRAERAEAIRRARQEMDEELARIEGR